MKKEMPPLGHFFHVSLYNNARTIKDILGYDNVNIIFVSVQRQFMTLDFIHCDYNNESNIYKLY